MRIYSVLLFLSLAACSTSKSRMVPKQWVFTEHNLCSASIIATSNPPFDVGVTTMRTDLNTRYDNMSSMRPYILRSNGLVQKLDPDGPQGQVAYSFDNWSKDGTSFFINRVYEEPQHAMLEEAVRQLIFDPASYEAHILKANATTLETQNLTADKSVSFYNIGTESYKGNSNLIAFGAIIDGAMRTYVMNQDGTSKRALLSTNGFAYGFRISPDGTKYAFHSEYKMYVGDFESGIEKRVETPCNFNFLAHWSRDSKHIAFFCGASNQAPNIYIADRNGLNARLLTTRNGYSGSVPIMETPDFHDGASDNMAWDETGIVYGALVGNAVELFHLNIFTGVKTPLTNTGGSTINYHPNISKDGRWIVFSSNRTGLRNTFYMNIGTKETVQLTDVQPGCGTLLPKWRP